jgi:universal stress protein A
MPSRGERNAQILRRALGAVRESPRRMTLPRTILVPTDFSEAADVALAYAADLAAQLDATIHLVHSISVPTMGLPEVGVAYAALTMESATKAAQGELDDRIARYRDRVTLAPPRIEIGDARDVIDNVAKRIEADLIVMGTHGRRGVRRVLIGSVAEAVVRSAPCPVLTMRAHQ